MEDCRHLSIREGRGLRCIHNDLPPRTRNFTLKGLFGIVIWIALWSLIITAAVSEGAQNRFRASQARVAR